MVNESGETERGPAVDALSQLTANFTIDTHENRFESQTV